MIFDVPFFVLFLLSLFLLLSLAFSPAFTGLEVDNLYKRVIQLESCSAILDSKQLCQDLMPSGGDFFLTRGHLAARSDFIFRSHQRASYNFLNVAPQWLTFNGGNWAILEEVTSITHELAHIYARTN